jgi:hypothetical protein
MPAVYDPIHGRIVCLAWGDDADAAGVSAFSSATGQWRWLLGPSTTPPPIPTLAPGATPVDRGTPPPGWEIEAVAEPSANSMAAEPEPAAATSAP